MNNESGGVDILLKREGLEGESVLFHAMLIPYVFITSYSIGQSPSSEVLSLWADSDYQDFVQKNRCQIWCVLIAD